MSVQLEITLTGMVETQIALENLGVQLEPITRRTIYNKLLGVRNVLTTRAPRPTYPINWDSERQRRAYFATEGFGGGIPTQRTGRTETAWRVVSFGSGYMIENPLDHAIFVYGNPDGEGQSSIHRGRYPLWGPIVESAINEVPPEAEKEIEDYAEAQGF